jgi:cell division protein ZapA
VAEVSVNVGGRAYRLPCRAGEEAALQRAADHVAGKAAQLTGQLGAIPEGRLLLMAALMVTDDYFAGAPLPQTAVPAAAMPAPDLAPLHAAIIRLETLAGMLETAPARSAGLEASPQDA